MDKNEKGQRDSLVHKEDKILKKIFIFFMFRGNAIFSRV